MTSPMMTSRPFGGPGRGVRPESDLGNRRSIGSYTDYTAAQKAVDTLSDKGFPVEHVSIVGTELKVVERVLGRMTTPRAAGAGAMSGAWFGVLIGLIFSFGSSAILAPVLAGIVLGAVFGAIFGAATHAALRGTRDFTSTQAIVASRYDVLVSDELFVRASYLLSGSEADAWGNATTSGPQAFGPLPPYGVGNGS